MGYAVFCAGFGPEFDEEDEKLKERHEEAASHTREQCMLEYPEDKGWKPVVVNEVSIDIDDPLCPLWTVPTVPTISIQRELSPNIIEVLVTGTPGPPKNVLAKNYAMTNDQVLANLMAFSSNFQLGSDEAKELYLWLAGQCDEFNQETPYHESVGGMQGQEFEVPVGSEWVTTNISVFPLFQPAVRPTPAVHSLPFLFPLPVEIQRTVLTMLHLDDLATLTGVDKASRSFLSAEHAAIFWNEACYSEFLWPSGTLSEDMPSMDEKNEAVGAAGGLCCCPTCGDSNKIDWMHYVAECRTSPNIRNRRRIVKIADQIMNGFKGRNDEDDGASDEGDGEGIDKDLV
ncbi:hypothetical protein HKX48_001940 [Thoreauomyces humboldtii]|nr:hypothetical protein HKX48_001940 [Thoreauomyces humboldtii]